MYQLSEKTQLHVIDCKYSTEYGADTAEQKYAHKHVSKKYVKILRAAQESRAERWMNFSKDVWESILHKHRAISVYVDEVMNTGVQRHLHIHNYTAVEVCKFNGCVYIGFLQVKKRHTSRMNLTVDEWIQLTSHIDNITAQVNDDAPLHIADIVLDVQDLIMDIDKDPDMDSGEIVDISKAPCMVFAAETPCVYTSDKEGSTRDCNSIVQWL
jgi:hypothetical protein